MPTRPFAAVVTMYVPDSDLPYPFNTIADMQAWVRNSLTLDVGDVVRYSERSGGSAEFTKDTQS